MRNYVELKWQQVVITNSDQSGFGYFMIAGEDDEDVDEQRRYLEANSWNPNFTIYKVSDANEFFCELNKENVLNLIKGNPNGFWNFNFDTNSYDTFASQMGYYPIIDYNEIFVDKSPRKTWAHGH